MTIPFGIVFLINGKMVNGSDITERWKASAKHQLCLPLLPFTHARYIPTNKH